MGLNLISILKSVAGLGCTICVHCNGCRTYIRANAVT